MTNTTQQTQIETYKMTEGALNGLSHLLTIKDWEQLLEKRLTSDEQIPLSAEFLLEHRNDLNLTLFPVFALIMRHKGVQGYDLNFLHKFWAFFNWEGGNGAECEIVKKVLVDAKKFEDLTLDIRNTVSNWVSFEVIEKEKLSDILAVLPSFSDFEKNPFGYCNAQFNTMLEFSDNISLDFVEKFIHLVKFPALLCNLNVKPEFIADVFDRFGVRLGRTQKFLFPDGTVAKKGNPFDNMLAGKNYLDNVQRYATEDEVAIKKIVQKFPRALQLCDEGENALVMQGK